MSNSIVYIVLCASILALAFAYIFFKQMMKEDEGTDLMKKIAAYVRKGAMAYLKQQYKVVTIVFVILAAVFLVMSHFHLQNGIVPLAVHILVRMVLVKSQLHIIFICTNLIPSDSYVI